MVSKSEKPYVLRAAEFIYSNITEIKNQNPDLVIALGVLIKGESDHFEYISSSVSNSISRLSIENTIPIIFGVLTVHNMEQAIERAYLDKKNKGGEAMKTGLKMLKLYEEYKK